VPDLNPEGLRAATIYYDAQVEYAERLVLENALSARDHGALILTYARVDRFILEGNAVRGVEFTDLLAGTVHRAHALVIVNVAGPWVDEVLAGLGRPTDRMIGGTKGSHIIVDAFPGAPTDALYVEAFEDRRPFFIIPWNNLYLIGTTDTRYEGNLDHVEADEQEIAYLIGETNRVIPQAHLTCDSVLYTYSGIRPLPYLEEKPERSVTRRYTIDDHAPDLDGLISIVGGKLTSYRNLSEHTVDILFKKLGRNPAACMTAQVPLPGANTGDFAAFSERFKANHRLPEATAEHLLRVYGTRAVEVLKLAEEGSDLKEPFSPETGAIGAEILMSFRREMAERLSDALLRRTMVGLGPTVGLGADDAAAKIAQKYLGWDEQRAAREVAAYRKYIERFHPRALERVEANRWKEI